MDNLLVFYLARKRKRKKERNFAPIAFLCLCVQYIHKCVSCVFAKAKCVFELASSRYHKHHTVICIYGVLFINTIFLFFIFVIVLPDFASQVRRERFDEGTLHWFSFIIFVTNYMSPHSHARVCAYLLFTRGTKYKTLLYEENYIWSFYDGN